MAYKQLTEEGKKFIRKECVSTEKSLLSGKSSQKIKDPTSKYYNPHGVLPFCSPAISPNKIWNANVVYNGLPISTNQVLAEALIDWYNKYGRIYEMDANVLVAQAFQESRYFIWSYALTSTASGISQFTNEALFDMVITNKHPEIAPTFTQAEIDAITKNINGNINDFKGTFSVGTLRGKQNRPILHQNIIDNPEIMIKAQFRYMKYIANKCNSLTSSTLFGYSRGPAYAKPSYVESINHCIANAKPGFEEEGIDYVFKIFSILGDKNNELVSVKTKGFYFGYDFLGMVENNNFNPFDAKAIDSLTRFPE